MTKTSSTCYYCPNPRAILVLVDNPKAVPNATATVPLGNASNSTTLAPTAALAADNFRWDPEKDDAGTKGDTNNTNAATDAAARTYQARQKEIISCTEDIGQLSRFNGQAAMVRKQNGEPNKQESLITKFCSLQRFLALDYECICHSTAPAVAKWTSLATLRQQPEQVSAQ